MRKTDTGKTVLSGIFTLAHKAVEVTKSNISGAVSSKLLRYARLDADIAKYNVYAFLIALFGKNNNILQEYSICGKELMDLTFEILKHVQYYVRGGVI